MEWTASIIIVIILGLTAVIYFVRAAKILRRLEIDLDKDWLGIELLLKQRNDELPRIIQMSRSYMPEEGKTFRVVADARAAYQSATTMQEKARADAMIARALKQLFAKAEKYPELKGNNTFTQLQIRLVEIEEKISERRALFNDDAQRFNARLRRPPGKWVRGTVKARPRALFEADQP